MVDANGIGLAATQVGVLQRLFVFQAPRTRSSRSRTRDRRAKQGDDGRRRGLLSIQGVLLPVERPETIVITGQDEPAPRCATSSRSRTRASRSTSPTISTASSSSTGRRPRRGARPSRPAPAHRPRVGRDPGDRGRRDRGVRRRRPRAARRASSRSSQLFTRPDKPGWKGARASRRRPRRRWPSGSGSPSSSRRKLDDGVGIGRACGHHLRVRAPLSRRCCSSARSG